MHHNKGKKEGTMGGRKRGRQQRRKKGIWEGRKELCEKRIIKEVNTEVRKGGITNKEKHISAYNHMSIIAC